MARRLPPLNALRAFEAGARHLSFTKAAEELHVTQAAISHQVKLLEEDLGVSLFLRMTRKLALTEEGRALMHVAGEALDAIAGEAARLPELRHQGPLHHGQRAPDHPLGTRTPSRDRSATARRAPREDAPAARNR